MICWSHFEIKFENRFSEITLIFINKNTLMTFIVLIIHQGFIK